MSFQIEKLPDTVIEQIFEYTENDTDFCYNPETNEMNFYFPMAYTNFNTLAALKYLLDRKSLIHKKQCSNLIGRECDKRVLVFSGNGGKMPLDFVRGQSKKIVVEWHSTQQMWDENQDRDDWDGGYFDRWPHKGSRSDTPFFSGIAKFYEFGPITNIGALSSEFIAQLDVYHGLKGKTCCISYKHELLDKFLKFQDKDPEVDSQKLIWAQLTEEEKEDYGVEYYEEELQYPHRIPNYDPVGFFVRMPHINFRPLKSIMFHRGCDDGPDGCLNGICFSNDENNFKPKMCELFKRRRYPRPNLGIENWEKEENLVERGASPSSDDTEPYKTNPVEWSRTESTTFFNPSSEYCDGDHDPLSEKEYFAYADAKFIGMALEGVKLFKMSICIMD